MFTAQLAGPPPSLAEQLKQVLAERERRTSEMNANNVSQTLVDEIRQAVNEANAKGMLFAIFRHCSYAHFTKFAQLTVEISRSKTIFIKICSNPKTLFQS